jgi:hypothetical protein
MRCKPPWTSTATAWYLNLSCLALTPAHGRHERTHTRDAGFFRHDGQHRRNVVGAHGVKLDAAPDAPSWGQVLACSPPVPVRIQRRAVAATDTHPSPHRHTRQARTVHGRPGCEAVRTSPAFWACHDSPVPVPAATAGQAASGRPHVAAVRDDAPSECGEALGWRTAQQLARPIGRSVTAGGSSVCGRHPRPGKDPS